MKYNIFIQMTDYKKHELTMPICKMPLFWEDKIQIDYSYFSNRSSHASSEQFILLLIKAIEVLDKEICGRFTQVSHFLRTWSR